MMKPKVPSNEAERLCALNELNILDTPPESCFDDITEQAKSYFKLPIALVSLVDDRRQWFKSKQGLSVSETAKDISFCGHAINHDDVLYVPDTKEDVRFATNPLVVGEPYIRFYAGAPLILRQDIRLGTLCVIDRVPREFSDVDLMVLKELAASVLFIINSEFV
ncbi:GAF domain-containing protein [Alteromonas sp. a30]|uniref:GAF domain-containing protein n=1 Tax=Alteromonas sp. a30 TaxID=2730917 RepID=UPI00227FD23F|nr:GAF domain-containing protein [Alteromonas sp. a30]MCY7297034.1 GAF domain-containing protein [Alteromonas sp. a30]